MGDTHAGGCFCGAVRFQVTGSAMAVQVCHCSICRRLTGTSMGILSSFWNRDGFSVTKGQDNICEFLSPEGYSRVFCKTCGARPYLGFDKAKVDIPFVAVYPSMFDRTLESGLPDEWKPQQHIYYADRTYDIGDGLPKFADMPAEFGGSGTLLKDDGTPA